MKCFRSGIGCFASKTLLAKALEMAISEQVRSQDSVHFMASVAARWEWFMMVNNQA